MTPQPYSFVAALAVALAVLLAGLAVAQTPSDAPAEAVADPMEQVGFLVGDWRGQGWIQFGQTPRRTFTGVETVRRRLDGTVIVVEGRHTSKMPPDDEEIVVHHALAVISWDPEAAHYRFNAWQADGRYHAATATYDEGTLTWGFHDAQRGVQVRFTIELTEAGHWFEIGEVSLDDQTWSKFFEMTMERVASEP